MLPSIGRFNSVRDGRDLAPSVQPTEKPISVLPALQNQSFDYNPRRGSVVIEPSVTQLKKKKSIDVTDEPMRRHPSTKRLNLEPDISKTYLQ